MPTTSRKNFKNVEQFIEEEDSRLQCMTLEDNVKAYGLTYFGLSDKRQGIIHIIGPEQGKRLYSHGTYRSEEEDRWTCSGIKRLLDFGCLLKNVLVGEMLTGLLGFTLPGTTVVCGKHLHLDKFEPQDLF